MYSNLQSAWIPGAIAYAVIAIVLVGGVIALSFYVSNRRRRRRANS